ncbi:kinase-like domain-containing protein [Amylocarpus encephaloides]|uniref:non-specific serine/threonine protein kinase n=1 Tax=Amylocarpus encephaloides TaxID=45428 RepID=A0A9P7YH18_9HELO|nr:kinase-like domain-containing protein [Amylocarpus encephaloides]
MAEVENYDILEKIGHGSFGIIRKVRRKQDGQILCRKEINYNKMSQKEREQLHAEFSILSSLRHPNIVGYYHREHLKSSMDLHLYMEYCGNGDLGRVIKNLQVKKQFAEEGFVWSMFAQLVGALYRCHYGVDAPDVGANVMGLGNSASPKPPSSGTMILHRDLKPENVFLGEDNSVKLGDFGLSKIMASHDFASTYVGTPFYMSPEICAAERYTLKSDIWSLGCIIYELCAREPPFNAKSHFQLVQKIKEGKVAPLPSVYSKELNSIIKECLLVNPEKRPDTVTLINMPVVKLMRKELEVVELGRLARSKEELASRKLSEAEDRLRRSESDKLNMRMEIDASLRREWEVKAALEISRQVDIQMHKLRKKFDDEVNARVELELQKKSTTPDLQKSLPTVPVEDTTITIPESEPQHQSDNPSSSSVGSNYDSEFTNSTDLTDMSSDSPETMQPMRKTRTPFGRAQTMFAGTPMDVEMAEPSPVSIASLSLSPRRGQAAKVPSTVRNIFTAAAGNEPRLQPILLNSDDSEDDGLPPVPSPTRQKSTKNPFKVGARPPLHSQKTVPVNKPSQGNLFNAGRAATAPTIPSLANAPDLRPQASNSSLRERSPTANRRLSKIPSSTNLLSHDNTPTSPTRKPSLTKKSGSGNEDPSKMAVKNNMIKAGSGGALAPKGRTLVELAQARAGGRPIGDGNRSPEPKRGFAQRMADQARGRTNAPEPAVWDPEREEMPSPFLSRTKNMIISRR